MRITVQWDATVGVATIFHDQVRLAAPADVMQWDAQLSRQLASTMSRNGGKKFPILVCMDEITIAPAVADEYGRVAKRVITNYASRLARYGEPTLVRQIVAVEGMKKNFRANLFETRREALASVLA